MTPAHARRCIGLLVITLLVATLSGATPALANPPPPTANPDSYATAVNTTLQVDGVIRPGVLDNDTGGGGSKVAVLDTNVSHGDSVTLNSDGTFNYTPETDFEGTDSFTYHLTIRTLSSAPATVTITIGSPGANTAPVATVSLNDSSPKTNDTLTATATRSDDEGDSVSLAYVWKVNGVTQQTHIKSDGTSDDLTDAFDLSQSGNGDKSDTVKVFVTPNDGTVDGTTVDDTATVANSAPVATTPTFSPSSPKTKDSLQASITTSDDDGDNVSVAWVWKVTGGDNTCQVSTDSSASAATGTRSVSLNLDQPYSTSNCTGASPPASIDPSKDDTVIVEVTPDDGTDAGTTKPNSVAIADSRPGTHDDGPYVAHGGTTKSVSAPGVLANDTDADPEDTGNLAVNAGSPIAGPAHGNLTLHHVTGAFDYTPDPGVCNRTDSFTYRATDGDLNSGLATASITVQTTRGPTTLTLKPSATRVLYGRSVFLTAHLSSDFSASAVIKIYGTPYHGTRKLLEKGQRGSGNVGLKVTPSRLTTYGAVSTDNCYKAGDSGPKVVKVAPRVEGHMVDFFSRDGRYALYHSGGQKFPMYHASVTPDHSGRPVRFEWQRLAGSTWKGYLAQRVSLNANSAINVVMTRGVVKGVRYRVRIVFLADADHLAKAAPWAYFRAT